MIELLAAFGLNVAVAAVCAACDSSNEPCAEQRERQQMRDAERKHREDYIRTRLSWCTREEILSVLDARGLPYTPQNALKIWEELETIFAENYQKQRYGSE